VGYREIGQRYVRKFCDLIPINHGPEQVPVPVPSRAGQNIISFQLLRDHFWSNRKVTPSTTVSRVPCLQWIQLRLIAVYYCRLIFPGPARYQELSFCPTKLHSIRMSASFSDFPHSVSRCAPHGRQRRNWLIAASCCVLAYVSHWEPVVSVRMVRIWIAL